MSITGMEFVRCYVRAFEKFGGDPDTCDGILWARDKLKSNPEMTVDHIIDGIIQAGKEGAPSSSWLLSTLRMVWTEYTEKQRVRIIEALAQTGSHKVLVNRSMFDHQLTDGEKRTLVASFERGKCPGAVRRING